jgi:chromosome segregation protein
MLTSLELFGFKSFADRTLFEFSPGITCVVGPNGSGKSNVVDAIKWILGDQSPKSLRGKEMLDVVFNGSSGRKPSGFAEATLTFNNRDRLFPVPAEEVRFGRRLYRSGESEYLLNGSAVRLKDIRDLFLGSGAGTAAYSIIEQGRVDQILQANPTTRRIVFEEAAGISRYKSRKLEAERKLEKVSQNLLRLTDIVDEVEAQLAATRSQASKAARYRELSLELKELWTGLAADDWRALRGEMQLLESRAASEVAELTELATRMQALEREKSTLSAQLAVVDDELRREERLAAAAREQIASRESTIRHQSARDDELSGEIERLRGERRGLSAEAAAVAEDLAETTLRLQSFEARISAQRAALVEREQACAAVNQELAEHQSRATQRRRERDASRQRSAENERQSLRLLSQRESIETAIAELAATLERIETDFAGAEEALEAHRATAAAREATHRAVLDALESARRQHQSLVQEQLRQEQSLAAARERRGAAVARVHVLEDLERRQEGVSVGVREILRRAHDSPQPPWNEVLGSVSDLLQVSLEHAPLIEVALGPRSQLIVVRRRGPLVEYLLRQAAPLSGRVGFLELASSVAPSSQRPAVLDRVHEPGVVCRADELVEEIPEVAGLAAQLLADTWIVRSLESGVALAGRRPGLRFVTEQGELVDSDGTVYAGSIPNTTALVSRRSELRDLKHEIIRLDRNLERGGAALAELATRFAAAQADLAQAEERARAAHEELATARNQVESQEREVRRGAAEFARAEELHRHQLLQRDQMQTDIDQLQGARAQLQQELAGIDADLAADDERIAGAAAQLSRIRDELKQQQLELVKHDERLVGLRDVLTRLAADQQQRIVRRERSAERLREVQESLRLTRLTILRTRSEADSVFLHVEELTRSAARLNARRRELQAEWALLSREDEQAHQQRRTLQESRHETDLRLRELRQNLETLEQRILEEYQQPLEEFVHRGASALKRRPAGRDDERDGEADPSTGSSRMEEDEESAADAEAEAHASYAELRPELEDRVNRLRRKLKLLGSVNTDALQELDDLEGRFSHLSAQLQDLEAARSALEDIIRRINKESRRLFLETFESIRTNFRELFRKVFGGGEGDIILEDPENVLDCGIDIVARPPGKELRSITLLSGGEKTMTAVALLFAMFKSKPSPYCILDEVDAALDEANVDRYVGVVREFARETQFVVITHRKRTMTAANVLYGVTMEQAGVSKRMAVRFEEVGDDGHFRPRSEAA